MLPDAEAAPTAPTPMAEAFPSAPEPKRAARDLLPWALAAGCALFAFAVALVLRGRTHPDEVFQYLEPAHRAVYGYGEQAWEWREGIRNWFVPGLLTLVLRGLRAARLDGNPHFNAAVIFALGSVAHGLGMLALFRLIEQRAGRTAAALGVMLAGSWLSYAIYAPRMLADALTLPPLLGALLHAQRARDGGRFASGLWAGLLLGLAVVLRYPSAVFGVPVGLSLLLARRGRALVGLLAGGFVVLLALGVLDRLTWGGFLHSLTAYLAFNRPGGPVAQAFGAQPWWWTVLPLGGMLPLALVPAFFRGVQRRPDLLAGCWFFYLLAIEVSAHKEARFVLPLIPLGIALAAGPAWETLRAWRARWPRLGLPLALGWAALSVLSPALQWRMNLDRDLLDAEVAAGRDPDLRGLLTSGVPWFAGGGGFYLQRAVPQVAAEDEAALRHALGDRRLTHALLYPDAQHPAPDRAPLQVAGFRPWKTLGRVELWRRPPEGRPPAL